ncbi:hypothetical protein [Sphaerisporangium album]|uniref:hypothetical protein n=1 Tax=Sphaerisporangium album TaxID=509200 RepID=UPI0011C068E5|nr:hypothetical protein [Sphaerisporangium album]
MTEPETGPLPALTADPMAVRIAALQAAVDTHVRLGSLTLCPGVDRAATIAQAETNIRRTAQTYLAWLQGTVRLRLIPGPIRSQSTGAPTGTPIPEGETVQLHDDEEITYTVDTEDAKGFDTPETITWSVDNPEVATLRVAEDTRSADVIAGVPGSATVTASIPALDLSVTEAIDVVPGGTATIKMVPGEVRKQQQ